MGSANERTRRRGSPAVAWLVLLSCVVVIMTLQRTALPEPTPPPGVEPGPSMDQLFTGRLLVGLHAIGGQAEAQSTQTLRPLLDDFATMAVTPADHLRVAVVEAELLGREAARERLRMVLEGRAGEVPRAVQRDARLLRRLYDAETDSVILHDDEWRAMLLARHGWFGRLALSHDPAVVDQSPAFRQDVLREARRTVFTVVAVTLGLAVTGLAGLVLLIVAVVLWSNGRLRPRYRPTRRPTLPYLETAAVFLLLMLGLSLGLGMGEELLGVSLEGLVYVLAPLAAFWPLLRGASWGRWRDALGLHRGAGVWREVSSGLVGYVAGLPIIALGLVLTLLLSAALTEQADHPVAQELLDAGLLELLLVIALAVVWAPVVEEAIFRGAFYHHMRRRWGPLLSAGVVGLVFAAIHPQGLVGVPVLTAVALVLAMIREWRGSLVGPVVAHAVHNFGATMILVLAMR